MYSAKILKDSVNSVGNRLTTFEICFPRILLAELNTHRQLSRNAASSRAIPVKKMIQAVIDDPFIPIWWGKNQAGMQANEEISDTEKKFAIAHWLVARDNAVNSASNLLELNVHKQIANRLLEPWMWTTIIVSATEWQNFFALRTHKDAMPEFRYIAIWIEKLYKESIPEKLEDGFWHIPMLPDIQELTEHNLDDMISIATGRIARVSLLTHDGKRDLNEDVRLHDRLSDSTPMHASPFEHCAMAIPGGGSGNFVGFYQYRHHFDNESVATPLYNTEVFRNGTE